MVASLIYLRARTYSPACLFIIIGTFLIVHKKGSGRLFQVPISLVSLPTNKESTIHLRIFASYYVISISTVMKQFFFQPCLHFKPSLRKIFGQNGLCGQQSARGAW